MICTACNAEIPQDSDFCPNCRAEVRTTNVEMNSSAEKTKATLEKLKLNTKPALQSGNKNTTDVIGIAAGAGLIVAGLVFFCISSPAIEIASFGGDFYTYTYDGIYAIARLLGILIKAISISMIAVGTVIECHFFGKKKNNTYTVGASKESELLNNIEKHLPQL